MLPLCCWHHALSMVWHLCYTAMHSLLTAVLLYLSQNFLGWQSLSIYKCLLSRCSIHRLPYIHCATAWQAVHHSYFLMMAGLRYLYSFTALPHRCMMNSWYSLNAFPTFPLYSTAIWWTRAFSYRKEQASEPLQLQHLIQDWQSIITATQKADAHSKQDIQ